MDRPLVSIVVPIYNTEDYLEECIDSILEQTYRNLQVILVDDGSSDGCGKIIEQYKSKDSRVLAVVKNNGGASAARNEGIKYADGEYIAFIDSDDILHRNYVYELLETINEDGADIAVCGFRRFKTEIPTGEQDQKKTKLLMDSRQAIFEMYKSDSIGWNVWDKLYRRRLFADIEFPDGLLCEDKATLYKLYLKSDRISYINTPLYYYRERPMSVSGSRSLKLYMDSLMTNAAMEQFFESRGLKTELLLAKAYSAKDAFILYSDALRHAGDEEVKAKCLSDLAGKYRYINHAKFLSRAERIAVFLAGFSANTGTKIVLKLLCRAEQEVRRRRGLTP